MFGAWRVGEIAGIEVKIHWSFFLLLMIMAISGLVSSGLVGAFVYMAAITLVFAVVVLHECGHAVAARLYGIPTLDITLLPIGGVARLLGVPSIPKHELVIAMAGPLVNVMIAAVSSLGVYVLQPWGGFGLVEVLSYFLSWMVWINLGLVIFNLIPAFPMDGGRILRALLAMRVGRRKATEIAAGLGRVLGVFIGILGVFALKLTLVLIGIFVWYGAGREIAMINLQRYSPFYENSRSDAYHDDASDKIGVGSEVWRGVEGSPCEGFYVVRNPWGRVIRIVRHVRIM